MPDWEEPCEDPIRWPGREASGADSSPAGPRSWTSSLEARLHISVAEPTRTAFFERPSEQPVQPNSARCLFAVLFTRDTKVGLQGPAPQLSCSLGDRDLLPA